MAAALRRAPTRSLETAIGVTRVARVTGLDRSGVEVACAVRPLGHVLQVSNGKGLSWEQARLGAVLEAAELAAAEAVPLEELTFASAKALRKKHGARGVWGADELGSAAAYVDERLWSEETVVGFCRARELFSRQEVLVPAQAVYCPPGDVDLGPIAVGWTTNGSGAHPDERGALLHALLEAAERDQLARVAPEGLGPEVVLSRGVSAASLHRSAPRVAQLRDRLEQRRFEVALFDLTPARGTEGALGLPVAGALLFDLDEGPIPLTAGYACRLEPEEALLAALLEAAQSRLTDIHGARDDIAEGVAPVHEALRSLVRSAGAARDAGRMPKVERGRDPLAAVLGRMRRAGFARAAQVDLSPTELGVHVAKVIVPGFLVSELLL